MRVSRLQFNNKYLNDVCDRFDSKSCKENDPFVERDAIEHGCFLCYVRTSHDIAHVHRHDDRFLFPKNIENSSTRLESFNSLSRKSEDYRCMNFSAVSKTTSTSKHSKYSISYSMVFTLMLTRSVALVEALCSFRRRIWRYPKWNRSIERRGQF